MIENESLVKIIKNVHNELIVSIKETSTFIIVVAIHKDDDKNFINKISCQQGVPIGGYVYNAQTDCYNIECSDFINLGYVSTSFCLNVENSEWECKIPIPDNVLPKFFSVDQKKDLKKFKSHFNMDLYKIKYIQFVDPN